MLRFVSGNKRLHAIDMANNLIQKNKIPIINYITEESTNKKRVFNEYIKLLTMIPDKSMIALKLSSLDFDRDLIYKLIEKYKSQSIKVIIDAEDNKNINRYRSIVNSLILKYNRLNDSDTIIKTYQMYRRDSLQEIYDDNRFFIERDCLLSRKLVRGAYWNSESSDGHLYTNKSETDDIYNKAIIRSLSNTTRLYNHKLLYSTNIIATHNRESIEITTALIDRHSILKPTTIIANLMGMNNQLSNQLSQHYNIATYLPYGPYNKMIPYLSRRLYENVDSIKYIIN